MTKDGLIPPLDGEESQRGSYSRRAFLEKFGPLLYSNMPVKSDDPAELNKAMYRRVYGGLKTLEDWGVVKLDPKPIHPIKIEEVSNDTLYELEYRLAECFVKGASAYIYFISGRQVSGEELNDLVESFKTFSRPKSPHSLPDNPKLITDKT